MLNIWRFLLLDLFGFSRLICICHNRTQPGMVCCSALVSSPPPPSPSSLTIMDFSDLSLLLFRWGTSSPTQLLLRMFQQMVNLCFSAGMPAFLPFIGSRWGSAARPGNSLQPERSQTSCQVNSFACCLPLLIKLWFQLTPRDLLTPSPSPSLSSSVPLSSLSALSFSTDF